MKKRPKKKKKLLKVLYHICNHCKFATLKEIKENTVL